MAEVAQSKQVKQVKRIKRIKRFTALKPTYSVLCHRVDCGEEEVFFLDGAEHLPNYKAARKLMLQDYRLMRESYSPEWTVDGKDHCVHDFFPSRKDPKEIWLFVPIWDGEREKESQISCHWSIIKH